MSRRRKGPSPLPRGPLLVIAAVVFVGGVLALTAITSVIWPGQAKLLAPIFCDDARPDPFVVSDTYSPAPGETSTNFTLYCVGPRGDHRDVGWFKPFLGLAVMNGVVIAAAIGAFVLRSRIRRSRAVPTVTPGPTRPARAARRPRRAQPVADELPPGIISVSDAAPDDDVS